MKRCLNWIGQSLRGIVCDKRGSQVVQFLACMALIILIATCVSAASGGSLSKQLDQIVQTKIDDSNHNIDTLVQHPTNVNQNSGQGTYGLNPSGSSTIGSVSIPAMTGTSSTNQNNNKGSGNWWARTFNSIGNGVKTTWDVAKTATKNTWHAIQNGTNIVGAQCCGYF